MSDPRYRLNVDFDNTIVPIQYAGTGTYQITVPAVPNFMSSRYVVFLPAVMVLNDSGKIPIISGRTRVEGALPNVGEWRTIAAGSYDTLLLKDAIEFNSADAGSIFTLTNYWTIGSTIDPTKIVTMVAKNEDIIGTGLFTSKSTGVNSDSSLGILSYAKGFLKVADSDVYLAGGTVSIGTVLTAGRWYVIYCDIYGTITYEVLTGATDYTVFPLSYLDSQAPVNTYQTARYKSGDPTKRVIGCAYSLPDQPLYAPGTTYARGNRVRYQSGANWKNYISIQSGGSGKTPDSNPTWWLEMGMEGYVFEPKIFNLPEQTFGTGELGDVTLDGSEGTLGHSAAGGVVHAGETPFYGLRENVTGTVETYPEYQFNNLTINGVCYCGKGDGLSLDPVVIRVKGTLTIGASGQLNGDSRGANGGAGGTMGAGGGGYTGGGAGGTGAKSGRPIFIYANKIVNLRSSGFWITNQAGNASNGSVGLRLAGGGGGGGGGGGASSSNLIIITNSKKIFIIGYNQTLAGSCGNGANGGAADVITADGGGGGGGGGRFFGAGLRARGGLGGAGYDSGMAGGRGGDTGEHGSSKLGLPSINPVSGGVSGTLEGGGGGGYDTMGQGGAGGGGGTSGYVIIYGYGGNGAVVVAGGGGGGGGRYDVIAGNGGNGGNPAIPHDGLGNLLVIDSYYSRSSI